MHQNGALYHCMEVQEATERDVGRYSDVSARRTGYLHCDRLVNCIQRYEGGRWHDSKHWPTDNCVSWYMYSHPSARGTPPELRVRYWPCGILQTGKTPPTSVQWEKWRLNIIFVKVVLVWNVSSLQLLRAVDSLVDNTPIFHTSLWLYRRKLAL